MTPLYFVALSCNFFLYLRFCGICSALEWMYKVGVEKEDEFTKFIDIGPVNQMINTLCVYVTKGMVGVMFKKKMGRTKSK